MQRWILSVTFKRDIIRDYGIYPESEDVLMEAVDQNEEYVQQAAGGEDQANQRHQVCDYCEVEFNNMYNKTE